MHILESKIWLSLLGTIFQIMASLGCAYLQSCFDSFVNFLILWLHDDLFIHIKFICFFRPSISVSNNNLRSSGGTSVPPIPPARHHHHHHPKVVPPPPYTPQGTPQNTSNLTQQNQQKVPTSNSGHSIG